MRRTLGWVAAALCLLLCLTACQKLASPTRPGSGTGPLTLESLAGGDAIPAGYGRLVGVTQDASNPWLAVLWFEGPSQEVAAVWVNTAERRVVSTLKIPRR